MLYQAYQLQSDLASPLRLVAQHLSASLWFHQTERTVVRKLAAACDVIARLDISPDLIFWSKSFDMDSLTDGQRRTCPAANDGLTLCIMPR
mgnify:CR=1 FL=1